MPLVNRDIATVLLHAFGKWMRRGWMGSGYLVARRLAADGKTARRVARFGED